VLWNSNNTTVGPERHQAAKRVEGPHLFEASALLSGHPRRSLRKRLMSCPAVLLEIQQPDQGQPGALGQLSAGKLSGGADKQSES